jgi:hypothetical protein
VSSDTGTDSRSAELRELLRPDPVGSLLLLKGGLHSVAVVVGCLTLLVLLLIVLPIHWSHLPPSAIKPPKEFFTTLQGTMMVVSWLVFVPVVWGFYAWQARAIVGLHERLRSCLGALAPGVSPVRLSPWYLSRIWPLLAALLGLWEFNRFMSPAHEFTNAGPWVFQSNVGLRATFVLFASLTYYVIVLLVVRQFITTISINRLFSRHSFPVRFLHSDGCGGLRFLGQHALGIAPLIAAAGLNLSLVYVRIISGGPPGSDTAIYSLVAESALYIVGSILFFTAPLWSAHREMLRARDQWLDDIGRGFELQQAVVGADMRSGNPNADSVDRLEAAMKASDIGQRLPTWPVNVRSGRQFSAALLSPLVPIALAELQHLLGL